MPRRLLQDPRMEEIRLFIESAGEDADADTVLARLGKQPPDLIEPPQAEQPQAPILPLMHSNAAPQGESPPDAPREGPKTGKRGRRRKIAPWFESVARSMANGTTLRDALIKHGFLDLAFDKQGMHNLYRNRAFKELYQRARQQYLFDKWGRRQARG